MQVTEVKSRQKFKQINLLAELPHTLKNNNNNKANHLKILHWKKDSDNLQKLSIAQSN